MSLTLQKNTEASIQAGLYRYISSPPENSRVIEFTPAIAADILAPDEDGREKFSNRKRKPHKITEYASAMGLNQWGLTGETVKFSLAGKLLDGQHRLAACVRSGCSFITHVVFGIDDDLFIMLDQGAAKSPADIFKLAGIPNPGSIAGACRWLAILQGPNPKQDRITRTPRELLDVHAGSNVAPLLQEGLQSAKAVGRTWGHPVPMVLAIWYMAHKKDALKAADFIQQWSAARPSTPMDKMQKTMAIKLGNNQGRIHDRVRTAMVIMAWNEFKAGRKASAKMFEYNLDDDFPTID